ncbi:HAD-IB family hydrolase [Chromohalobacter sarecensis]|uniref:HAD-IB family hydrolase n=1 Tax=Chromohalobacter sarecensis TaxID=245294 RepID=A0ABV9D2S4_9GAMM|nr:HAD-IB family hydrolase [Chromohalobacter sarecensis]MCK0715839.1 HAD-IB family hydrolase [Chromohalobacter sarecensis]
MNQLPEFDTRPVAFFDFDGTLTTGDTLMPFLKFVVGKPTYYAKLALLSPVLGAYYAKILRNDIAKQIVLKQYLGGCHIDELFALGERFSEEVIPTMLRPEGMERLRWHQAQGHECVLVSASMNVYLKSWAKRERFSAVICTELEVGKKGYVSGKIQGKNCHGEEKVRRIIISKLDSRRLTYAYGDSKGDLPMLKLVDHGFVFERGVFSVSSI